MEKLNTKSSVKVFLKGMAMGVANVIPGVSGGTIALITGVFERIINAIKSFDATALKLLWKGSFKSFARHIDLRFLLLLFSGVLVAIISMARLFEFLFVNYPVYIWSYFFGLVMASVYFVGRTVKVWHVAAILSFIVGTTIAVVVSVLSPASENSSLFYLFLCGVVATCSMILPGLSGSFVLILMGNYQLIMIDAVTDFRIDLLLPVLAGAVLGLIAFSHFLSWLLKRFPDSAIAVLSGFILGSIGILWPWKTAITQSFGAKTKIVAYNWELPQWDAAFAWALLFIILGILSIAITEIWAIKKQ